MKIFDTMRAKRAIRGTAQQFGVSRQQCRADMQAAIDEAWATADPAAQAEQQHLFPAGKPTVEEFLAVLGKQLQERNG